MWFVDIPPHPNPLPISRIKREIGEVEAMTLDGALLCSIDGWLDPTWPPLTKVEEMTQEGTCRVIPLLQNSVNE